MLGKRVVVQHIPLGGLLEWEHKEEAVRPGIGHRATEPWTSTPRSRTQISSMHPPVSPPASLNASDRLSSSHSGSLPFLGK